MHRTLTRGPVTVRHLARAVRLLLAPIAVLVLGYPALLVVGSYAETRWSAWQRCRGLSRFDAGVWRAPLRHADRSGGPGVRSCMVEDLLARHRLVGQSRGAVVALLGEPAPASAARPEPLVYALGATGTSSTTDPGQLVVRLDAAGRVVAAEHHGPDE